MIRKYHSKQFAFCRKQNVDYQKHPFAKGSRLFAMIYGYIESNIILHFYRSVLYLLSWHTESVSHLLSTNYEVHQVLDDVPQESVLEPLIFLLKMNDYYNCSTLINFHTFADDTNLFIFCRNLYNLEKSTLRSK